jgi:hypothetical protein
MHLEVPFIAPRQLGAVGGKLGRPSLPSVEWRTGQSGAPPDSYCSLSGVRLSSKSGTDDRCSSGPVGAPDTVRCTPDSPVPPDCWSCHASREDCATDRCVGDRWLTEQSGAPPDSPVNYSHVAFFVFPRATSSPRRLTGQSDEPPDGPVNYSRTPPSSPESGLFTRTSLAHRTLSGAPPDSPVCQAELKLATQSQIFFQFFSP